MTPDLLQTIKASFLLSWRKKVTGAVEKGPYV